MGYPAFWVRDSIMMLGERFHLPGRAGGLDPAHRLDPARDRGNGRSGRASSYPPYAVPDHINFDGLPTFYPGNYETGDKQGGAPWGKYPPLDDHFYFIGAVYEHWKMTGSPALFKSKMKTTFSEERLADLCEKIYRVAPADPGHGNRPGRRRGEGERQGLGFLRRRIQERAASFSHRTQIPGRRTAGPALRRGRRTGQGQDLPGRRRADQSGHPEAVFP